jgi:hypothetical protein
MSYRPAFTKVVLDDQKLFITGSSPKARNQLQVVVAVQQGQLHAEAIANTANPDLWEAVIPVANLKKWPAHTTVPGGVELDPLPPYEPFDQDKPLEVFGTETRGDPFTTITWRQEKHVKVAGADDDGYSED